MNLLRFQFLLFLLYGSFFSQVAIGQDFRFKHLTTNEGLSQNAILAIVQDKDGYLWLGTKDGLNKYDGYEFTVFQHDPSDSTSVASNYITALFTDQFGKIWIGTENGIVSVYSKETQKFQRILLPLSSSESTNTLVISCFGSSFFNTDRLNGFGDRLRIKKDNPF